MPDGEGTHKRVCTHDASHVETAGCTYGDWSTNQDSHWKTCTVCGGEAERLNHADPDCNHFCDTCGIKMTEHDFTGETAITALLYKEANCISPALYYKSLQRSVCCPPRGQQTRRPLQAGTRIQTGTPNIRARGRPMPTATGDSTPAAIWRSIAAHIRAARPTALPRPSARSASTRTASLARTILSIR